MICHTAELRGKQCHPASFVGCKVCKRDDPEIPKDSANQQNCSFNQTMHTCTLLVIQVANN